MSEMEHEDVKTVNFVFSDGETLTFQVGAGWTDDYKIVNGGLHDAALVLASVAASGVVGEAASNAVKFGIRFLRQRLHWGAEDEKRAYVAHIAQLAVAAKLDKPASVKTVSCVRQTDHWAARVVADGQTYRVQIPPDDPRPTAISVDLD